MNDDGAGGTSIVFLEMFDQAAFAEGVKAFRHRGGVHQVPPADFTRNVTVEGF